MYTRPAARAAAALPLSILVIISGCTAARPDPQAERAVNAALGIDAGGGGAGGVAFRTEGAPVDEQVGPAERLTLPEAIRKAVTTDPGLQAALARVRIAMAEADQARLLPNPVLSIVLRWGPGTPQVEASLTGELVRVLTLPRRASAADNRLRQAAADAVTVALDTLAEVQERYTAAQALDGLLPMFDQRAGLLDKLVTIAESRLRAHEGTRNDLTTLQAQRAELEVQIAQTRIEAREERLRLARLVGEPSGAAAWSLDAWTAPEIGAEPEARWVDTALQRRPEVQSVAWQLAALGDEYALTRLLPFEPASAGISTQQTEDGQWFTGPGITTPIPVFDMGQAQRARLTAAQIEARHNLTLAKRKTVEEVRVAYATLAASRTNLARIRDRLIPLQQQRRDQAEAAFRNGQTDATPLFLAEQDLRAAQARAIEVERQTATAVVRLQRAVGGPAAASTLLSAAPPSPPPAPAAGLTPPPAPSAPSPNR